MCVVVVLVCLFPILFNAVFPALKIVLGTVFNLMQ